VGDPSQFAGGDDMTPVVRGWCPGAFRPMEAGDGWLVRVNPPGGRLTAAQAAGLAAASIRHGNGRLDLTSRAALQIRGVRLAAHPALLDDLAELGLLPPGGRDLPGIVVTPFWTDGDGVQDCAATLAAALQEAALPLPAKFGFAVTKNGDLADLAADIRVDCTAAGYRVNAIATSDDVLAKDPQAAAMAAVAMAQGTKDARSGRSHMAGTTRPVPGPTPQGALVALAFGELPAEVLDRLGAVRLTPWRMLVVEGPLPDDPALITNPDDPLLRVVACPGAPFCPQAQGATRAVARHLAAHVPHGRTLHVSGCAKGCACPHAADTTLTAAGDLWDLAHSARAGDSPSRVGLTAADLKDVDALQL
jgi:precorrin-3B synthase